MKISTQLGYAGGFAETVAEIQELESAGLDTVWVAEAYGFDAVSLMGYIAAKTEKVEIASGILPIYTRTPTLLAMTAAGVDALSNGRAMLGLGASGPQVIEGFHGVAYDATLEKDDRDGEIDDPEETLAETPGLDPSESVGPERHARDQQDDDARQPGMPRDGLGEDARQQRQRKGDSRIA